jgi:hypothetical protein
MLKTTAAVLATVLAGSASAGWRDLAIDGSSEENFVLSVTTLRQELSRVRGIQLDRALTELWVQGTLDGIRDGRAYTADDYFAQLDGLGFKDVLDVSDPTGDKRSRWKAEAAALAYRPNVHRPDAALPPGTAIPHSTPVSVSTGWFNYYPAHGIVEAAPSCWGC